MLKRVGYLLQVADISLFVITALVILVRLMEIIYGLWLSGTFYMLMYF